MARIEDLPTELMNYVTDHLHQASDLAALARTSHRIFDVVDPVLYKFAKANLTGLESWHPLRWAAENGHAGTLKKAIIAGIDANMLIDDTIDKATRDMQSFQIRVEAVDGSSIWDPPRWDPSEEWRPRDDDSDRDQPPRYMLERSRVANPQGYHHGDGDGPVFVDDEDTDDSEESIVDVTHDQYTGIFGGHDMDSSDGSELSDDDQDRSSVGSSQDDDLVRGFRAIHLAARGGHDDAVRVLLDNGADIDVCSGQLCTCEPGYARSHAGHHGAPLNGTGVLGFSPLHLAICHFHVSTAKHLLSQGASIRLSEPRRDGSVTALHAAAATGQVEMCRHLLDGGYVSDVDILDSSDLTPFYYAYLNGHWKTTVAFLLERGANIDLLIRHPMRVHQAQDDDYSTILYEACAYGRYEDAIKLVHLGANVSKGQYRGDVQTLWPLHAACRPPKEFQEPPRKPPLKNSAEADKSEQKRVRLIETLLRQGADIEAKSHMDGDSPLHFAAKFDIGPALRALLVAGAKVDSRDHRGRTPLMVACVPERQQVYHSLVQALWWRTEENMVRTLLDHGSRIGSADHDGNTALHLVSKMTPYIHDDRYDDEHKQERVVRLLLERGANESARNKLGMTPLETAFMQGSLKTCDILLRRRRADRPLGDEDLDRMLLATIKNRPTNFEALDLILDLDTDGFFYKKSTYLMAMVDGGHVGFAAAYLERGRSVPPLTPKEKTTILHLSIERGFLGLAKRMLDMKVSVNSLNKNGHTPLYATVCKPGIAYGRDRLVEALLDAGADIHFRPHASPLMAPLEKAIVNREHSLVDLMLRRQPLRSNSPMVLPPLTPRGVYLHTAARTAPSKEMFSALIRSGASVTETDANGDIPLSVFLQSLVEHPTWMVRVQGGEAQAAANRVCATIWYLWSRDVDINRRNKAGKSILSYLTALRLYSGRDHTRDNIAHQLQRCIAIVPAGGRNRAQEDKTLEFRHGPLGLGSFEPSSFR